MLTRFWRALSLALLLIAPATGFGLTPAAGSPAALRPSPPLPTAAAAAPAVFRPPAVPLVAVNPYFSIWSFASHLTGDVTRHWTGAPMPLTSLARVDGHLYRLMGDQPRIVEPARQLALRVLPTRTIYDFQAGPERIELTFLTPDLPQQIGVLSRPVTYLIWQASSFDGQPHQVEIYFACTAALAASHAGEPMQWSRPGVEGLTVLRLGTVAQPVLGKAGDFVRIDWGYFYAAAPVSEPAQAGVGAPPKLLRAFARRGALPAVADAPATFAAGHGSPVLAFTFDFGAVGAQPVARRLLLAYDEIYPIEYFHRRLRGYWQRGGTTMAALLQRADRDYASLQARSRSLDQALMADLASTGGRQYAQVAALAYRQAFAANTLALGPQGRPLMFLKEISSCGCAQTADVIYPESPLLLLMNPKLLEYSLAPLLDYARSQAWPYPWAPHDLGTFPLDNARTPSRMESMPVEETGNMLLMIAGIAQAEGRADFAARYWPLLTQWARYLKTQGLDPGNQLCTDDFTGLLAHNANLSLKAILGLGSYALLARRLGHAAAAARYQRTAENYARRWLQRAGGSVAGPTRLAFDRPGTWSQKYNLIWDQVLGLNLFPASLARSEINAYASHATRFGFPLDSRSAFTKLDWESWSAALADSRAEFKRLFAGVYHFAQKTPNRVPLSDWYWTVDGSQTGFQARPVVGGVYMRMLTDPALWRKWARNQ